MPNFNSMTRAELLDYAEQNGVSGVNGRMKKADILSAITGE
jgi:hypothetical protein